MAQWIKTSEDFFRKICTSHFIVRVRKGLLKVLLWEGVGDRIELQYIDSHTYGHQRCVFLVLQSCSTGGLGAHSVGFLYGILSPTDPQTPSGVPQFRGHSLPVHQSMSISWAFALSHFVSQIRLHDFFRLLAIGMCHFLPVHHFGMACLAGSKVNMQHWYYM